MPLAIQKAVENARKSLIRVPKYGQTLTHKIIGRYGAGHVVLRPASPGTGVIAAGSLATRTGDLLSGVPVTLVYNAAASQFDVYNGDPPAGAPIAVYYAPFPRWACSSIGQSRGLIIPWFQVRVLAGPPYLSRAYGCYRGDQGIGIPWSWGA